MSTKKREDKQLQYTTDVQREKTFQHKASIQSLPEELFEIIAGFLSWRDLDSCFSVCSKWRRILNSDKFWKKCCKYPEKYFKLSLQSRKMANSKSNCIWRNHFLLQRDIWENWNRGRFATDTFSGDLGHMSMDLVDNHGSHWLFCYGSNEIVVYNITDKPLLQSKFSQEHFFALWPLQDKVLTCRSNYVKVFHFRHPENQLELSYRFKFNLNNVLPEQQVVPDDDYVSGVRYILVDNRYLVGYQENINDIETACIHIWDINAGTKVGTNSVYQQSFIDFIRSARGRDDSRNFVGGMVLFDGDNGKFLVNLIDDRHKLCHISLFSLVEMKFVKVVAHFESRTAWCIMRGDIAVIFHIIQENSSQISVYNIYTGFLAKLHFPSERNPILNNELRFDCNKVILKVRNIITVLTLTDCHKVHQNSFTVDEGIKYGIILKYFDPKFLLLYDSSILASGVLSVWDIYSESKLWALPKLTHLVLYRPILSNFEYPGRLLVHFENESQFRILKFDSRIMEAEKS